VSRTGRLRVLFLLPDPHKFLKRSDGPFQRFSLPVQILQLFEQVHDSAADYLPYTTSWLRRCSPPTPPEIALWLAGKGFVSESNESLADTMGGALALSSAELRAAGLPV
jgi:hypothetical protein